MYLQIYNNRNSKYVRICESYRDDKTGKPKMRVLETFGSLDKLLEQDPNAIEKLKVKVQNLNDQSAQVKQLQVQQAVNSFFEQNTSHCPPEAGFVMKNYGVKVYEQIWKELKLDNFFDYRQQQNTKVKFNIKDVVSMLVYARLLEPCSKLRTYHNQQQFISNNKDCKLKQIYRSLGFLCEQKDNLEQFLNKQIAKNSNRNVSVAFYDVTTYYFESTNQCEIKNFGYSKDNKVNQTQVVMGLLIDDCGIPISYELFAGNTNEFQTMQPILENLKQNYGINKIIITADRGLNSKKNLALIKQMGFEYVIAFKIRSATKEIKDLVLQQSSYTVNPDTGFKHKIIDHKTTIKLDGEQIDIQDRLLLTYSPRRANKDIKDRERLVTKAHRLVDSASALKSEFKKGGKKYVKTDIASNSLSFDYEQELIDQSFDGYYGIICSDPTLTHQQILDTYHGLWKIEESFRVLKTNLEARPIFVWTEQSTKGHFAICYLALVIQRILEHKLKQQNTAIPTRQIQDAINSANVMLIQNQQRQYYLKSQALAQYEIISQAVGLKPLATYGEIKDLK